MTAAGFFTGMGGVGGETVRFDISQRMRLLAGKLKDELESIDLSVLMPLRVETEQDGTDGTSFTRADSEKPVFMCVTEHTRNIDGTAADGNLLKAGDWRCLAWQLERAYPAEFARPEVALSLIAQNKTVENHLTINITGAEASQIEAQALPVRQKVAEMIARYRPAISGNGESKVREVEALAVVEQHVPQAVPQAVSEVAEPAIITHSEGDEKRREFWKTLVTSNPQSLVAKETAILAIRTLLLELQGFKAHRAQINFDHDPVTAGDLFDKLEKLCGGSAGWQLAQKLSGY
jgi:hypothetical protein